METIYSFFLHSEILGWTILGVVFLALVYAEYKLVQYLVPVNKDRTKG